MLDKDTENRALQVRSFNRFYTDRFGLVNQTILQSPYTLAEARLLLEIDTAGHCAASDLTRQLRIDPGYASRLIARFVRNGLVSRLPAAGDRRVKTLSLTESGRQAVRKLYADSTQQAGEVLSSLTEDGQRTLVGHMTAIQEILSAPHGRQVAIRMQRPGDASYIAYRHAVLYDREYGLSGVFERYVLEGLVKYLSNRSVGEIWIAENNGQPVGSIAIVGTDGNTAQLRWFLIEPEFRGTGLGRRLMTQAVDYCRQQKFRQVFLWTFQELAAARHLYSRFGFTRVGQEANDIWKPGLIEERWELCLDPS